MVQVPKPSRVNENCASPGVRRRPASVSAPDTQAPAPCKPCSEAKQDIFLGVPYLVFAIRFLFIQIHVKWHIMFQEIKRESSGCLNNCSWEKEDGLLSPISLKPPNNWQTLHFLPKSSTPMKMVSYAFPRLKGKAVWWLWDKKWAGCVGNSPLHQTRGRAAVPRESGRLPLAGSPRVTSGWSGENPEAFLPFFPQLGGPGACPGRGCDWATEPHTGSHSAPEWPWYIHIWNKLILESPWSSFARKINNVE